MAMHVAYDGKTWRVPDDILPGNSHSETPTEFDIVPAWGPDAARCKSIVFATTGLTHSGSWSPEIQEAVMAAFQNGAPMFINTITDIRGLTVDAAMALRAGLIEQLPAEGPKGVYRVTSGVAFSRLAGALMALALHVAMQISTLTGQAEKDLDPRFFRQPSGSGGKTRAGQKAGSNVRTARRTSRNSGTAGNGSGADGSTQPGS